MKHILILSISTVLLVKSMLSEGNVFNHNLEGEITIFFNGSLPYGDDLKTTLEKSVPQNNSFKIKYLTLINVPSREIFKNASFSAFNNLSHLTIQDSKISSFPDQSAFEELTELFSLSLINIGLKSLSAHLFESNRMLRILRLYNNDLEELPGNIFKNLSSLNEINLNSNKLKSLSKGIFRGVPVIELHLMNNSLTTLEEGVFPKSLWNLDLSCNNISHVDENTFKNLTKSIFINMTAAFTIDVVTLPKEFFPNSRKLQIIDLSKNHIQFLEDGIFDNLTNLQTLDLSSNKLASLSGEIFENNIHLQKLNLSNNQLQQLSKNIFSNLLSLLELDLSNNKLGHLHEKLFFNLARLSALYISCNEVYLTVDGEVSTLQNCVNLTEIHANNNNISKVYPDWSMHPKLKILDLRSNPLPQSEINTTSNFSRTFYFSSNNSTRVKFEVASHVSMGSKGGTRILLDRDTSCEKSNSCSCVINIDYTDQKIILDCNRFNPEDLGKWPYDVIEKTRKGYKVELMLANCGLTSLFPVAPYLKEVNTSVTKLVLSGNNIINLADLRSLELPALVELALDHNNFKNLDETDTKFIENSRNLTRLTLHENPWKCDCQLEYLYNFLQIHRNSIDQSDEITCENIPNDSILSLKFDNDNFCPPNRPPIVLIGMAIVALFLTVITGLYYLHIYEKEVKVWIFSKPSLRFLVSEKEMDRHLRFDAFISYATPDEKIVVNELVPELESGEYPYRVCFHQRDWKGGDFIPTQIHESVENSRRTIIVMSPHFLNSFWGKKEFQAAYMKSMKERCSRILIIMLEPIDMNKLDDEMRAYITTNTYFEWKDPRFWQKLRYALPHRYRIHCRRTREHLLLP